MPTSEEKLYTHSQYHLTYRIDPAQEDDTEVFETKEKLVAEINRIVSSFPNAVFEVFYGHKVRLKPKKQIMSYEVDHC